METPLNKEQLEQFWKQLLEIDQSVGLSASTMDDAYDKVHNYAREQGIDSEELEIEY